MERQKCGWIWRSKRLTRWQFCRRRRRAISRQTSRRCWKAYCISFAWLVLRHPEKNERATMKRITCAMWILALAAVAWPVASSPALAQRRGFGGGAGVYKSRITPHWFEGGAKCWYQNDLARGTREFILVDAEQGKRERAFDHEKLAAALREAGIADARADRLPIEDLQFKLAERAVEFRAGNKSW